MARGVATNRGVVGPLPLPASPLRFDNAIASLCTRVLRLPLLSSRRVRLRLILGRYLHKHMTAGKLIYITLPA